MKVTSIIVLLAALTGCAQQPIIMPQQQAPQNRTVIIRETEHHRPTPPVIVVPPPRRPGVDINIGVPILRAPSNACSHDHHCGHCDICRRNGWTVGFGIEFGGHR